MAIGPSYKSPRKGQALTAKGLDANIVKGPQRGMAVSGNADLRRFQDGLSVDLPDSGGVAGASNYIKQAQIEALFDDYYEVKEYAPVSASTVGSTFAVGKPYNKQITLFPSATEVHEVGDIITILKAVSNVSVGGQYLRWVEGGGGGGSSVIKSADNKTALTALMNEGDIGYTTGTTKRFYVRVDATTICISHLE